MPGKTDQANPQQVVLTDRVDKLAVAVGQLAEARKPTDERMNALITIVGGIVRERPDRPN